MTVIRSHVTGHANALFGLAALTAPRGARGERTGRTMFAFRAVRGRLTTEVMPLHDAGRAFALARADHVDELDVAKQIDPDGSAGGEGGGFFEFDFTEVALHGRRTGLWHSGP